MTNFIFFNGPPSCGKDTAGLIIMRHFNAGVREFKYPIHAHFAALAGMDVGMWISRYEQYRSGKVELPPRLRAIGITHESLRQDYIDYSEKYLKPRYGNDVFGVLAAQRCMEGTSFTALAFTDCGFIEEVEAVYDLLRLGPTRALLVQIHRPGHTFGTDSRSYVSTDRFPMAVLENNDDLLLFEYRLVKLIKQTFTKMNEINSELMFAPRGR